jgi:hypothetical protein
MQAVERRNGHLVQGAQQSDRPLNCPDRRFAFRHRVALLV